MIALSPSLRLARGTAYTFWMSGRAMRDVALGAPAARVHELTQEWAVGFSQRTEVEVIVFGAELLDAGKPCILMANHQSYLDVLALCRALPIPFGFVAKKQLFALPLFGGVMRSLGCVAVDRDNREQAVGAMDEAGARVRGGSTIAVFPEGTRSAGDRIAPMKKGPFYLAQRAGVPVVPIGIRGTERAMPRENTGIWSGRVEVHIGAPLPPIAREGSAPRQALMDQVRAALSKLADRPMLDDP
ncbi:MAG: lysophospholipid acyltransferase family protein [Minicystis sp.]